jgi:phosphoesterase RecJ-like protein
LDCGDLKRIGSVSQLIKEGIPVMNIDHHVTNTKFGIINAVDAEASSTCELIYGMLKNAKFPLNKDIATLLYAGIMTDTGSFRYDNTTAYTHRVTADLMTYKIPVQKMHDLLYRGIPVSDIKLFTQVVHDAQLVFNDRVYCLSLTQKTVDSFSKNFDIKEKLFSFLRSVEGIEVVAILTELSSKEVRVNFRSQSNFNVAKLAQQFDGGGHIKAAGCKIGDTLPNAQTKILTAIKKLL